MRFLISLVFIFIINTASYSQLVSNSFGKNRIQYKNFKWQVITTSNFEIYYYQDGTELAERAAAFAENDFERITNLIGYSPYDKIRIIVYNTADELHQSNIGLIEPESVVGGHTNFVKSKIEIAYTGNMASFQSQISYGISSILLNIMMYGGSLKEVVQSSYLLSLPEWFIKGLSSYISKGWDLEMDSYIRYSLPQRKFKNPQVLNGNDAVLAGHSIWNFIAAKYGPSSFSNVLNLSRIIRSEESGIESAFGIPYEVFLKDWKDFYSNLHNEVKQDYVHPDIQTTVYSKNNVLVGSPKINPAGTKIILSEKERGKFKIKIVDIKSGKVKTLFSGGVQTASDFIDPDSPVYGWKDETTIAVVYFKNGSLLLQYIDTEKGKLVKKKFDSFNQINSISFSDDGIKMLMSASRNGQTDIFTYDISKNTLKQVTNDIFDDHNPIFIGASVAYISNRDSSGSSTDKYNNLVITNGSISYNLTQGMNVSEPAKVTKDEIAFLSDKKGIQNLFIYNSTSESIKQVSNFLFSPTGVTVKGSDAFALFREDSGFKLYHLPQITNKEYKGGYYRRQKILNLIPETESEEVSDKNANEFNFSSRKKDDQLELKEFKFESDNSYPTEIKPEKKINPVFRQESKPLNIKGPYPYKNIFAADEITTTLLIDPLRGMGILLEGGMSDLMGNHRINAGIFGLSDFKSSNFYTEYLYLKKRVDFKARYDRRTLAVLDEFSQKFHLNKLSVTASYPLSVYTRFSLTPFIAHTRQIHVSNFSIPDITAFYQGIRGELVYDKTNRTGLNMIEGTRMVAGAEQYYSNRVGKNFAKVRIDVRHYQKIHRELIFASRLSYGSFFGPGRKNFLLGGMDNWWFNATDNSSSDSPLRANAFSDNSDFLFHEFVTPLRGFIYNSQFGPQHILFNAELRLPLIKYITNGEVTSGFFRNLQFVGFYDIGSAWAGSSPFSKDNSINTQHIGGNGSPFTATVTNYGNPFLMGYGVGIRTLLLGYYTKVDVGWGIKDGVVLPPVFYFTFGYDF
ncbi:MAG: hypothetical protein ACK40G_04625 [Cytophagaceae bacterium]